MIILVTLLLAFTVHKYTELTNSRLNLPAASLFEVKQGTNLTKLCEQWRAKSWFSQCTELKLYAKFFPSVTLLKAGVYELKSDNVLRVLQKIKQGQVHQFSVTFIEGYTYKQLLSTLKATDYITHSTELELANAVVRFGISQTNPEGWFYPDTYHFKAGDSDISILQRAHNKMVNVLENAWLSRQQNLPINSPYEALILASIIEKESGVGAERPLIASVFINRLNKKMRLQTDPTVIYGIGDEYEGDITRAHLKQKTPYNTYRIDGLPPTPIAMPSQQSLHAALNPLESPYYYFVANGEGKHTFSETLQQHNMALRQYLQKLKNDS